MFYSKFYSTGAIAHTPRSEVKEVENQPRLNQNYPEIKFELKQRILSDDIKFLKFSSDLQDHYSNVFLI